jgi:hypothetical protein
MATLWGLKESRASGELTPHCLQFSREANQLMIKFERWLEPQLAPGAKLSYLGGWAAKLAGAIARIAAGLHMAAQVPSGGPEWDSWDREVHAATVEAAIRLGKDYFLRHALIAFGVMGTNKQLEDAQYLWRAVVHAVSPVSPVSPGLVRSATRRDMHRLTHSHFQVVTELDPAISLLVREGYLRPVFSSQQQRGRPKGAHYLINPIALERAAKHISPGDNGDKNSRGDAWEGP